MNSLNTHDKQTTHIAHIRLPKIVFQWKSPANRPQRGPLASQNLTHSDRLTYQQVYISLHTSSLQHVFVPGKLLQYYDESGSVLYPEKTHVKFHSQMMKCLLPDCETRVPKQTTRRIIEHLQVNAVFEKRYGLHALDALLASF